MSNRERSWSPPSVVDDVVRLAPRTNEGQLLTARGHWSNIDVYLVGPGEWGTSPATLRVYAIEREARVLMASANLSLVPYTSLGGGYRAWLAISVRGNAADGWDVTGVSAAGTGLGAAWIYAETWGTESTQESATTSIQSPVTLTGNELRMPRRAAHLTYYDDTLGVHRLVLGDSFGRPKVIAIPEQLALGGQGRSPGLQARGIAVNFGCKARWVAMTNTDVATRYLQVFDKSLVPNAGDVPVLSLGCPAGLSVQTDWGGQDGLQLSNGFTYGISTDPQVFASAGNTGFFQWIAKE